MSLIDQVKSLNIGECVETCPCQHDCAITLNDGQTKTARLWAYKIEAVLKELPLSKVVSKFNFVHFSMQPKIRPITADRVIANIFPNIQN